MPCQLGGGIRDEATIAAWLEAGLERVVVGTQALRDPDWFGRMARAYPGRLLLGLDARDGQVATQGWLEVSSVAALALAQEFDALPMAGIIYTDIARDGTLEGPNLDGNRRAGRGRADPGDRLGRGRQAGGSRTAGDAPDRRVHRRPCSVRRTVLTQRGSAIPWRVTSRDRGSILFRSVQSSQVISHFFIVFTRHRRLATRHYSRETTP